MSLEDLGFDVSEATHEENQKEYDPDAEFRGFHRIRFSTEDCEGRYEVGGVAVEGLYLGNERVVRKF